MRIFLAFYNTELNPCQEDFVSLFFDSALNQTKRFLALMEHPLKVLKFLPIIFIVLHILHDLNC